MIDLNVLDVYTRFKDTEAVAIYCIVKIPCYTQMSMLRPVADTWQLTQSVFFSQCPSLQISQNKILDRN